MAWDRSAQIWERAADTVPTMSVQDILAVLYEHRNGFELSLGELAKLVNASPEETLAEVERLDKESVQPGSDHVVIVWEVSERGVRTNYLIKLTVLSEQQRPQSED